MTNTISVPRELLERIVGKCKLSVLGDDHAKVWELLAAAPKAEPQSVSDDVALLKEALKALENVGLIDTYVDFDGVYATEQRLAARLNRSKSNEQ